MTNPYHTQVDFTTEYRCLYYTLTTTTTTTLRIRFIYLKIVDGPKYI